ncbi:MAG: hypothetical protein D6826_02645 [Alphaproteobacteria bacterium]|nr:MAG: hypothetical protein D6826_02645 [Alphaproteobacteria bacterium]
MRITRIDFEGRGPSGRCFAIAQRRAGTRSEQDTIEVTVLTPECPDGSTHRIDASDEAAIRTMAESLQRRLDGHPGTGSEVEDYLRELLRLRSR